jgi:hypothetical protein
MNKSSPEYIRVREEVLKKLYEIAINPDARQFFPYDKYKDAWLEKADSILEIKGLAILCDDQELPHFFVASNGKGFSAYELDTNTTKEILNAGFVKVVK